MFNSATLKTSFPTLKTLIQIKNQSWSKKAQTRNFWKMNNQTLVIWRKNKTNLSKSTAKLSLITLLVNLNSVPWKRDLMIVMLRLPSCQPSKQLLRANKKLTSRPLNKIKTQTSPPIKTTKIPRQVSKPNLILMTKLFQRFKDYYRLHKIRNLHWKKNRVRYLPSYPENFRKVERRRQVWRNLRKSRLVFCKSIRKSWRHIRLQLVWFQNFRLSNLSYPQS